MNISNINGSNPYATNNSATPPVDSTQLNTQNKEVTEPNSKTDSSTQQAFEVSITQEAQDLLAAQAAPPPQKTAPVNQDSEQNQTPAASQEARQIVNIVA